MKSPSDSTIIICSIVRNAAKGLKRNIPEINKLAREFKDYRIFVYENDSTDNTKKILGNWQAQDLKRIHVSINDSDPTKTIPKKEETPGVNPFFSCKRIQKMANIRNHYLEYIEQNNWDGDFLLVVDLDVAQIDYKKILTSFEKSKDWDVVTAFGHSMSPRLKRRYHDTYALTEWGDETNPQTEQKIHNLADKYGNLKPHDNWIRVYSAFGGLSIYKFEAVKGLRYQVLPNDDSRVEVRCEHFSLNKQIIDRGFDKIYINPGMDLKYQKLSPAIIYNRLRKVIGF